MCSCLPCPVAVHTLLVLPHLYCGSLRAADQISCLPAISISTLRHGQPHVLPASRLKHRCGSCQCFPSADTTCTACTCCSCACCVLLADACDHHRSAVCRRLRPAPGTVKAEPRAVQALEPVQHARAMVSCFPCALDLLAMCSLLCQAAPRPAPPPPLPSWLPGAVAPPLLTPPTSPSPLLNSPAARGMGLVHPSCRAVGSQLGMKEASQPPQPGVGPTWVYDSPQAGSACQEMRYGKAVAGQLPRHAACLRVCVCGGDGSHMITVYS